MGLVMFARYCGEDPLSTGTGSTRPEAMVLFFVMDMLRGLPGLPGLFVACLFSATLSTISSALNSLAAVTMEDLIKPQFPLMSDRRATHLSKGLAVFFGLLCVLMACVTHLMGDSVLLVALKVFGMVGGPVLGLFCLGMFFPWANSTGAVWGLGAGLGLSFWVGVGSILSRTPGPRTLLSECGSKNSSGTSVALRSGLQRFYSLSYMWYSGFSCFSVIIIGLIISFCTGLMKEEDVAPGTLVPLFGKLLVPEGVRHQRTKETPQSEENKTFLPEPEASYTEHETSV
uniref:Uncharacterized protein n=1 Tax=Knipowitschia caucasica TaxID=637954 RepID=A0AAV2JKI1_KNICA